ncbi:MAG TPA: hypothetical protein VHS78_04200 [Candidatus Elarobacter sp.]|nr:hypothetical protein [Candidatus Elarobacter sp.]
MSAAIALAGFSVFVLGLAAWLTPGSRLVRALLIDIHPPRAEATRIERFFGRTREQAASFSLGGFRLVAVPGGAFFFAVGAWATAGALQCPSLPSIIGSAFGPLEISFSPTLLLFPAIGGLIAIVASLRFSTPRLIFNTVGAMCWAFAASQASVFRTGVQADRWSVLTIITWVALVATNIVAQYRESSPE